jgi:hypothetical protein
VEPASVVAQDDGFPSGLLIVAVLLVSGEHQIFVAVVVQIGESQTARPPVGLREGCIYGEPVSATNCELVGLECTARQPPLNKGVIVSERPEEKIGIPVVIDVAPRHSVPPPVFGHLIGNAFLVRYVGEGNARRSRGGRRHPASPLLGSDRIAVRAAPLR